MDRAIVHAHCRYPDTTTVGAFTSHDQVEREILDEEVRIIFQALLVKRMKHGMAGTVCRGTSALHRRAVTHILHMAAKGALIDRTVFIPAEGHAGMLQLVNGCRRFTRQIFNCILVTQPV